MQPPSTSKNVNEYLRQEKINNIVEKILKVNIDSLSIKQVYELLYNIQNELKNI